LTSPLFPLKQACFIKSAEEPESGRLTNMSVAALQREKDLKGFPILKRSVFPGEEQNE
jgi:hypothetical protein